ncbi:MAG: sulfotransferase family 2 domain-containing protein [Planctomycetota bacterium]
MSAFLLEDPDCVLIHIPKTAGRSIRMGIWKGQYKGPYFGKLPESLDSYFKFAFVRNPFDRICSVWRMFSTGSQNSANYKRNWTPDPELQLSDILEIVEDESIIYDERRKTFKEIIKHHAIPMTHPFNSIQEADFVGKFESLEEDWKSICVKIDKAYEPLPHMNFTESDLAYRESINTENRIRIEKIYREDLETFGYCF